MELLPLEAALLRSPLNGPGHGQGELVQVEDLAQVLPAGRTDGPQRVTAALQLRSRHVLVTVGLQKLQCTLGRSSRRVSGRHVRLRQRGSGLRRTYGCVAVRAGEHHKLLFCQIFQLVLLRTHGEDGLQVRSITGLSTGV